MSLATAAQEGIFLSNVLKSLNVQIQSILTYEDNQGAIELTKSTKNMYERNILILNIIFLWERGTWEP